MFSQDFRETRYPKRMSQKEDYETKADVLENTCCENK